MKALNLFVDEKKAIDEVKSYMRGLMAEKHFTGFMYTDRFAISFLLSKKGIVHTDKDIDDLCSEILESKV